MSEKNSDPALRENEQVPERGSAPGTMLVSILLLIAGLLLTSALLIDHALSRNGGGFAPILAKAKGAFPAAKSRPDAPEPSPQAETSKPGKKGLLGFSFGKKREKNSNVRWPRLKLSGLGKPASGETGFAIINGKQVDEGTGINGATVVEILDQGARVEYQGETKILSMEDPAR